MDFSEVMNKFFEKDFNKFNSNFKNDFQNYLNKPNDYIHFEKYHFFDKTDFDRIVEENSGALGFIVIGKNNAVKAIKNIEKMKTASIVDENNTFKYCFDPKDSEYIYTIINKDEITQAIQYIHEFKKSLAKINKDSKRQSKKQVLVFN